MRSTRLAATSICQTPSGSTEAASSLWGATLWATQQRDIMVRTQLVPPYVARESLLTTDSKLQHRASPRTMHTRRGFNASVDQSASAAVSLILQPRVNAQASRARDSHLNASRSEVRPCPVGSQLRNPELRLHTHVAPECVWSRSADRVAGRIGFERARSRFSSISHGPTRLGSRAWSCSKP